MGRLLLTVLTIMMVPYIGEACEGSHEMGLRVRQVGPPLKIVEKRRPAEFIVFRGDMRMQKEENRMALKAQQREQEQATTTFPIPADQVEATTVAQAPMETVPAKVQAPAPAPITKPTMVKVVKVVKAEKPVKAAKATKPAKASKVAKVEKPAKKSVKASVASAKLPKKHRIQRAPASIGSAIVLAE